MFAPEAYKFVTRCLIAYSVALLMLGLIIGMALKPSHTPAHYDYPAHDVLDNSFVTDLRGA